MSGSFTFAESSAAIIRQAGANVSTTATGSEAIVLQASDAAEGRIMAETRYNFLDGYAALSSYAKFLLKSAVCRYAANDLIAYDMSLAPTRTEFENRINLNRAEAKETIALLVKSENAEFVVSGKTGVGQ